MIELRNIKLKEYFELEDKSEYDFAIKYSFNFNKEVNIFEVDELMKQPFGLIKDMQYYLNELTWERLVEFIEKLSGIDSKKIGDTKLIDICQFKSWIVSEINKINLIEEQALSYDVTEEEKQAGIDELSMLGTHLQIRSLANDDLTKYEAIRSLPYELCFTELFTKKKLFEYQERLWKIKSKANHP